MYTKTDIFQFNKINKNISLTQLFKYITFIHMNNNSDITLIKEYIIKH